MSDLPGAITKQILVAPPTIMRSTRYSLTARGRSVSPSRRLPTGRSSFEKASGWILLPAPAAGMIPHILCFLCHIGVKAGRNAGAPDALGLDAIGSGRGVVMSGDQGSFQFARPVIRRVFL